MYNSRCPTVRFLSATLDVQQVGFRCPTLNAQHLDSDVEHPESRCQDTSISQVALISARLFTTRRKIVANVFTIRPFFVLTSRSGCTIPQHFRGRFRAAQFRFGESFCAIVRRTRAPGGPCHAAPCPSPTSPHLYTLYPRFRASWHSCSPVRARV